MTALFAKLYLDENIDILLAALMAHRGFYATTAHAAELLGADDSTQLFYASTHGYCLVTHNLREFEQLHQSIISAGQTHAGIVIASAHNVYTLATRLVRLLDSLTADEIFNQLLYI